MEEKKETKSKLTYEQLEQVAMKLQQRVMMVEDRLRAMDFVSMRLTWLFKVVKHMEVFPTEFVDKCAKEIEDLLTIKDGEEQVNEEEVNAGED